MKNVVTGAYSFTGRFIASELLRRGEDVKTLTRQPPDPRDKCQKPIASATLQFENRDALIEVLRGAEVFYNTYWVRFNYEKTNFEQAIANSKMLLDCAAAAGVRKFVHVSVTNPSETSPLGYYRGKAMVERLVKESGLKYAIIRPTLIFGPNDLLINNIAWVLRHFPVFGIFGNGSYRVQPVSIEDVARLSIDAPEGAILDAAGPEVYRFDDFVKSIAQAIQSRAKILHLPRAIVYGLSRLGGLMVRDRVLTSEEIDGLMAELLITHGEPTGQDRFSLWLAQNSANLGQNYASELGRNYAEKGASPPPSS